jgi:hypothetical protein
MYNCPDLCTLELLTQQTMDSSITQLVSVDGILELEKILNIQSYPYEKSFELKAFFIDQFGNATNFKELAPSKDTINSLLFSTSSNTSLLQLNNAIDLYNFYTNRDLYGVYKRFQVTSLPSLNILATYIFYYLPSNFLYRSIKGSDGELTVLPTAIAFNSLLTASYKKIYQSLTDRIKEVTLTVFYDTIVKEKNNLCVDTMKDITVEPIVSYICNNEDLNMKSYRSLKNWILPYYCLNKDCKKVEKKYLLEQSGLLPEQIARVYDTDTAFGQNLNNIEITFNKNYNCDTSNCSAEELAKKQIISSYVTSHVPTYVFRTFTIRDWDTEFNIFEEYSSVLVRKKCSNCNQHVELFIDNNSTVIEAFTLERNNITKAKQFEDLNITDPVSQFETFREFIMSNAFYEGIEGSYNITDLLNGQFENNLDILTRGSIYDNFKPNINKTTGFNLNQPNAIDSYIMTTGRNTDARSIVKLNDMNVFNTHELIYNNIDKEDNYKLVPLYNGTAIPQLSDGIQFSTDKFLLYYYDSFTSRALQFKYFGKVTDPYNCLMYYLSIDMAQGLNESYPNKTDIGTVYQKFNKPYVISTYDDINKDINVTNRHLFDDNENNHICIDEFTEYILFMKVKLVVN